MTSHHDAVRNWAGESLNLILPLARAMAQQLTAQLAVPVIHAGIMRPTPQRSDARQPREWQKATSLFRSSPSEKIPQRRRTRSPKIFVLQSRQILAAVRTQILCLLDHARPFHSAAPATTTSGDRMHSPGVAFGNQGIGRFKSSRWSIASGGPIAVALQSIEMNLPADTWARRYHSCWTASTKQPR